MPQIDYSEKFHFDDLIIKPTYSKLSSREEVNLVVDYETKFSNKKISGVPVISANMDTISGFEMAKALQAENMFCALHKYIHHQGSVWPNPEYQLSGLKKVQQFLEEPKGSNSFVTIGMAEEDLDILKTLKSSLSKVCIDVANGYMQKFLDFVAKVRDLYPDVIIMAGNVATPEGVEQLEKVGVDICKAGIANGGHCDTKNKAGVGYPQLSVCLDCSQACKELGILLCSDGGIKKPADICKGIAAGANFIMAGGIFGGYMECCGRWEYDRENKKNKMLMYGMSSKTANFKYNGGMKSYRTSEGLESYVDYKGPVKELCQDIKGSLASCCTYTNNKCLQNLSENAILIRF
jgi:GMP reductase